MEHEIKNNIVEMLNYLADEDSHFLENCECDENIQEKISETENYELCSCDSNKDHIWFHRERVREWLENFESQQEKYKQGFDILMKYWDSLQRDQQKEIDKELTKLGL